MSKVLIASLRALKLAVARLYSQTIWTVTGTRYAQLVVCGYPRSGTSLLYNMLSSTLVGFHFEEFERPVIHRIHRLGNIASKYPLDVFNVGSLLKLNIHQKKLMVIGMIRDPRDLVTSRHPITPDRYFIGYDHSWWPQDDRFDTWKYDAPGIVDIFEALQELGELTDLPFHQVRYEHLVADPNAMQDQLAERFGLDFSGRFVDFHRRPEKLAYRYSGRTGAKDDSLVRENKPADASRAGKWRKSVHNDRIREQFRSCPELFEILRAYGYESDDDWFEAYQG